MKFLNKLAMLCLFATLIASCNKAEKLEEQIEESYVPREMIHSCRVGTELHTIEKDGQIVMQQAAPMEEMTKADGEQPAKYIIPVVFHIFGANQGSGVFNEERMQKVVEWINNDFHGIKNTGDKHWFGNVKEEFDDVKSNFPEIELRLAKYDEEGNETPGFIIYSNTLRMAGGKGKGFGDSPKGDPYVKKYAWNNKMYVNIFVTQALYGFDDYDSGVSWFPDMSMTNNNTARVVYNGKFMPAGTYKDKDFTSIITHELGHFFNLYHTFQGNRCTPGDPGKTSGDRCPDTPQVESSSWELNKLNCDGVLTNYENYMNYGYYANFTKDQVDRMKAAMNHAARKTLWSEENLRKTLGIGSEPTPEPNPDPKPTPNPEPSTDVEINNNNIMIKGPNGNVPVMLENGSLDVFNRKGDLVYSSKSYAGDFNASENLAKGTYYYVQVLDGASKKGTIEIL